MAVGIHQLARWSINLTSLGIRKKWSFQDGRSCNWLPLGGWPLDGVLLVLILSISHTSHTSHISYNCPFLPLNIRKSAISLPYRRPKLTQSQLINKAKSILRQLCAYQSQTFATNFTFKTKSLTHNYRIQNAIPEHFTSSNFFGFSI